MIKDEEIWMQWDFTEPGIARALIALSVPQNKIVPAYRSPFVRQLINSTVAKASQEG